MSTPNFDLEKLEVTDGYSIDQFNGNMDIIDTEMAKPPLTVNDQIPDASRNIEITTVPLADNLTSDEAQINMGTYIERSSGGEASIASGDAWLSDIRGYMVKTGYVPESIDMTVTPVDPTSPDAISAVLDRGTFVEYVLASGTITLTYTTGWSADPEDYGITVSGIPAAGDQIVVVYVKENRGTITTANPSSFISTGWNLYNHASGYARVVRYSDEYGFMISGTYSALKFSSTLNGVQTSITPVDGYFTIPSDGYVFVTGGNGTDTEIWMTWSDWTEEANGGVFEAYSQTSIDLSGVMVNFPYGLMRVGNVYDEINLNIGRAYSRIERLAYTQENIDDVIALGLPYDTDSSYIYAVLAEPLTYNITLDGSYTVSDHGIEFFLGTTVPVTASSMYGNDLKNKLRRDTLTISQQTLTDSQKAQVQSNLGLTNFINAVGRVRAESLLVKSAITNSYVTYNNYNGRKFSNYQFILINGYRDGWCAGSILLLRGSFTGATGAYIMTSGGGNSIEFDVKYKNDTSFQAKYISSSSGTYRMEVIGINLTA